MVRSRGQSGRLKHFVAVLIFLLSIMVGNGFLYYRVFKSWISYQTEVALRKYSDIGMIVLRATLDSRAERLRIMASFCGSEPGDSRDNWVKTICSCAGSGARIGAADTDGELWYGNSENRDISDCDYYKRVMNGEQVAYEIRPAGFSGEGSLVIAVPRYGADGSITGVLCEEFNCVDLGNSLNSVDRTDSGTTLVINEKGNVVFSYAGMDAFSDFYEMMEGMDHRGEDAVERLKASVRNKEKGFLEYVSSGRRRLLYHQPAGVEDWCIISLVDAQAYQKEKGAMRRDLFLISTITIICFIGVAVLAGMIMYRIRQETEKGKRDFLTDVYDRKTARYMLERHLEKGGSGCCFFLDIDNFKNINDTKGHVAGDRALQYAASLLKQEVRHDDVVSRYGGDEFCIWLWELRDEFIVRGIAERLVQTFRDEAEFTISMGVSFFAKGDVYEEVIRRADRALYFAKENGRNQFALLPEDEKEAGQERTV